jgi:sec-independent protein translocase protein TatC
LIRRLLPRRLRHGEEATLVEHLGELRHRLVISLFAIVPVFIAVFIVHEHIFDWLKAPLPDDKQIVTLGVTEPFTVAVKVSLLVAIACTLPVILWQLWGFLAPAMTEKTQRQISIFVLFATALFAGGVMFSYTIILPAALDFLTNFDEDVFEQQIRANYYFSFVTLCLLATGLAFQMPIFILALVRIGVLSSARLRRNRRIGILLMVIFAILLPTVDPVSLALETVPLLALYELSIWLAVFMEKRWEASYLASWDDDEDDWRGPPPEPAPDAPGPDYPAPDESMDGDEDAGGAAEEPAYVTAGDPEDPAVSTDEDDIPPDER